MIEFSDVGLTLGGRVLLRGFDWRLPDAGVHLLLGATGSGKSVLARMLCGRLKPRRGAVTIDSAPLYRAFGGYGGRLFYAAAEQSEPSGEAVEDYFAAELRTAGAAPKQLGELLAALQFAVPGAARLSLNQLSHGARLLAQVVLALALPVRAAVLDGHLSYLDATACQTVSALIDRAGPQDKFLVLTAARMASFMPQAHGMYVLRGGLPIQFTPAAADDAVDAGTAEGTAVLHCAVRPQGFTDIVSGRSYTILGSTDDTLTLKLAGALEEALAELAGLGVTVLRVDWRRG